MLILLAVISGLASGMSGAANYNLRFVNPGNCPANVNGANAALNSSCRYTNVVVDNAGTPLPAASIYQRDVIVTLSKLTGGAVVAGTTTNPDAWDNDKLQLDGVGAFRPEFFTPTVTSPNTAGATAWAEFTFQFVPTGGVSTTTTPLPGTFYMTSFDTDGNTSTLREFIEFVGPSASGISSNPASADQLGAAVDGGTNYEAITDANQAAIGSGAAYKASAQFATPGIVKFAVGARQGASSCSDACERLSAYSFQVADSVVLYPSVDGSKSVKLTTDADGNGVVSPGDTLTYTVTYTNTGNAAETGFQITDALPAGVTITAAGAQTVRLNGTVTAGARNTGYTGAVGKTGLLAAGRTLPVGGTVSVSIPVTVNAVAADNTVLSNQTNSSGSYTNAAGTSLPAPAADSDNVDSTTVFPPSTAATTGFGTVPAGSVAQTQVASVDPTTVNVRRLPTLTLSKTIAAPGRVNPADQFTVQIKNGATVTASANTTGTGTTAATGITSLLSGTSYTLTEVMAAGSISSLTSYTTAASCTNSTVGGLTTLPTGAGQSFTLTPALGDVINCTLTNTAKLPSLSIGKTNNGPWVANQAGATYTLTVSNAGPGATSGVITVQDQLPVGITPRSISGFTSGTFTCTYPDELATGSPAPDQTYAVTCTSSATIASGGTATITLPVEVNPNAVGSAVNYASVGGGGDSRNAGAAPTPSATCTPTELCTSNPVTVTDVASPPVCTTPAQTTNLLTGTYSFYDSVNGQNITRNVPLIANSPNYVSRGSGAGKAYVVDMSWGWNNGTGNALSPKGTVSLLINGTVYATLTTNDGYSGYATFAALNGATIAGSEMGRTAGLGAAAANAYVTLPTSVTAISSVQVRWVLGVAPGSSSDDDGGVIIRSINACAQYPVITLLKLGRNVSASPSQPFIGSVGSIGAKPGDTVEYCVVYSNTGGAAPNFKLTDNVPAELNALVDGYATGRGVRWADGTVIAVGATAAPTGSDLTSIDTDTDKGSLTTTLGLGKGIMTLDLGTAGLAAGGKGTVCFQTKVP
ncbi:DUF11 domain-containing protein [Deinococcus detaillensis]|uniref:DUF11 domain-containing protein n=1 Tax=Deinococcus detaillensis TaxID=2592048 RepID=A0A553UU41_9DEIO|nr:isopeptide-forming domain-containing fimbrial protein [Deinococcus detaillensis]TSA83746.1 DUF11 domain-containing protein [Deinococcus detaillensis]